MFKVGDKVVCVVAWHAERGEKEGQIYTVAHVSAGAFGNSYIKLVELMDKAPGHNFRAERYAHASPAVPNIPWQELGLVPEESDPSGISLNTPGAKADAGKLRPSLVLGGFAKALEAVVLVGTKGAAKYTDNGWKEVPNGFARYSDAQGRHELKRNKGETHDADSGDLHLAAEAWNALAKLQFYLEGKA